MIVSSGTGTPFAELNPPYATIVADPPWHYEQFASDPGATAGRDGFRPVRKVLPYSSMTVAEIAALPVPSLAASDCWVLLWTTNRYLPDSFGVLGAWGASYRQTLVWSKVGNPTPFGGTFGPNHAEFLLVAAIGSPARRGRIGSSVIASAKPQVHSSKPAAFMDAIEACCDGPFVELFSRSPRFGWDSWGHGYESKVTA